MPDGLEMTEAPGTPGSRPWVSIGVLTWGDHLPLVERCVRSLETAACSGMCELIVAANAPSPAVRGWLHAELESGRIDRLLISKVNLFKNPMMRHVIRAARGDYLWWFDDDSHVVDAGAFHHWWQQVEHSSPCIAGWGATAFAVEFDGFDAMSAARDWVRAASWYRGLEPPGGPRAALREWWFLTGGCWWMRLAALRALDWPDRRLRLIAEDILLGEAVRQQGWHLGNIVDPGISISDAPRRGDAHLSAPL